MSAELGKKEEAGLFSGVDQSPPVITAKEKELINELAAVSQPVNEVIPADISKMGNAYTAPANFDFAQRIATMLSHSTLVPESYRGPDKISNCVIALELANRIGTTPFIVMQNLHIIQGRPSWSSTYIIATVNTSGKFKSQLKFEFIGTPGTDEYGCRAYAQDAFGEKVIGSLVTMKMAKDEGWYAKNGSKWKTMPEQMMMYRAAAFFARVYCPEVLMGMQTADEVIDITDTAEDLKTTADQLE